MPSKKRLRHIAGSDHSQAGRGNQVLVSVRNSTRRAGTWGSPKRRDEVQRHQAGLLHDQMTTWGSSVLAFPDFMHKVGWALLSRHCR